MARQRHTPKGRLLITGTVLLILLVAGILTAGRTINGVAVQMSGRIVRHISEYHYRLLQVEFERSEGVLDASVQFMRERTAPTDAELHVLAATLMRMDPKAGCVWFAEAGGRTIRSYPRGKTPRTTEAAGDFRQRLIDFMNEEAFALMKNGVRILNFARGDLVNNKDLLVNVASGKISKYISDFAAPELIGRENIIILPHLGASTPESEDNCAKMAVNEIKEYLENGNIINSVNFPGVNQVRVSKVRLCIINKNVPNILASISKLFADYNLNIENMVNRSRGEYAYTLIDTNDDVCKDIIEKIETSKGIISVRSIIEK